MTNRRTFLRVAGTAAGAAALGAWTSVSPGADGPLYQGLEELQGDRNLHQMDALKHRDWDVVIDNPTTLPFRLSTRGTLQSGPFAWWKTKRPARSTPLVPRRQWT
ncbi:MAG: twin-arginine translocation signal domain-containing protein [Phycisphaerae bacterium]|nr:twin-arginine translocation signal domain-containing protein [Gemmatimonadaceae bacterium]